MYLLNGQPNTRLAIRDRGLAYGDGIFETIAIINSQAHNWELHFQRLKEGAERLQIELPEQKLFLDGLSLLLKQKDIKQKDIQEIHTHQCVLKIIVTRGEGGKGYQCPQSQSCHWIMMLNEWPEYPQSYYLQGIDVQQLDFKLSMQPVLAGIKHLNRLEQVMAKQLLDDCYQEALVTNTSNFLVEGISSNIYFVKNNILCLPQLDQTGINGTIRTQLIRLCYTLKIDYKIDNYTIEDIYQADEVFYSNSIIGLWPVKQLVFLNKLTKSCQPGSIYLKLAKIINTELNRP